MIFRCRGRVKGTAASIGLCPSPEVGRVPTSSEASSSRQADRLRIRHNKTYYGVSKGSAIPTETLTGAYYAGN